MDEKLLSVNESLVWKKIKNALGSSQQVCGWCVRLVLVNYSRCYRGSSHRSKIHHAVSETRLHAPTLT